MLPAERLESIKAFIDQEGTVNISELTDRFQVSKPTVLRDLKELEKQEMIIRVHGGAKSKRSIQTNFEPVHFMKEKEAVSEKEAIAGMAMSHIHAGETILLDSGSTTLALARKMASLRDITVITNDMKNAMVLSDNDAIDLVVIGGQKRKGVYSLNGPFAEDMLKQLHVDKVFLGTDAIDFKSGLTNSNIDETNVKKAMIDAARETILLADRSKFHKVAFTKVANVKALNRIITNELVAEADLKRYNDLGITVETKETDEME
ncbi:DeoR/GlpR family DNA-binding transcription regulator [Salibacterium aidingense]|uniref:DeoR/GlpR family DNA-binding transcription regulator n=1 Tax=Salibacterium aidingense TaxID=384933 RepID=UPI003BBC11EC